MYPKVIENVVFKLKSGSDETKFLADNAAMEAFCRSRPGFVARRLSRDEDGNWLDHVEWADRDAADGAAKALGQTESVKPWLEAIDMASLAMRHYSVKAHL